MGLRVRCSPKLSNRIGGILRMSHAFHISQRINRNTNQSTAHILFIQVMELNMDMDLQRYTLSVEDIKPSFFHKGGRFDVLQGKTQLEFDDHQPMEYHDRMLWPCNRIHGMERGELALDPFVNPHFDSIRKCKTLLMEERGFWKRCQDVTKSFFLSKDSPVFEVPLTTVFMAEMVESFACGTHYGMDALALQLDLSEIFNVPEVLQNPEEHRLSSKVLDEKFETEIPDLRYKFSHIKKFLDNAITYQQEAYEEDIDQERKQATSEPTQNGSSENDEQNEEEEDDRNVYKFLVKEKEEKSVFQYLIQAGETQKLQDAYLFALYYYQRRPEAFLNNMYTDVLVGQLLAEKHQELVVLIGSDEYMSVYAPLRGRDLVTVTTIPGTSGGVCDYVLSYPTGLVLYSTPQWKVEYHSSLVDWEENQVVFKAKEVHYIQYIMRFNLENIVNDKDTLPCKVGLDRERVKDARKYKGCYSVEGLEYEYKLHLQSILSKKRKKV